MKTALVVSSFLIALAGGKAMSGALPDEQSAILKCDVSDASTATNCEAGNPLLAARDQTRISKFVQIEQDAPDFLVGARPGDRVLIIARRSLAAPLDGANPGRARPTTSGKDEPLADALFRVAPSRGTLRGYFPDLALRNAISGDANVRCTVGSGGDLLGCWVAAETPANVGFGLAALEISTGLQLEPSARDGREVAGRPYDLHVVFGIKGAREYDVSLGEVNTTGAQESKDSGRVRPNDLGWHSIPGGGSWLFAIRLPDIPRKVCAARLAREGFDAELVMSRNGGVSFVLSGRDWAARPPSQVAVKLSIDTGPDLNLSAGAIGSRLVIPATDPALKQRLRDATTLDWTLPTGHVHLDATGLGVAQDAVWACLSSEP